MTLLRIILAAFIAISVAVLPATGEAVMLPSGDQTAMADQVDMPCCPCCNLQADPKLTTCALKCLGIVGAVIPAIAITPLYLVDGVPLPLAADPLQEFLKPPPTHPPPA